MAGSQRLSKSASLSSLLTYALRKVVFINEAIFKAEHFDIAYYLCILFWIYQKVVGQR
jgi:hypothetical protein